MSPHRLRVLALSLSVLSAAPAVAEDSNTEPTEYHFDDDLVDGTARAPTGEVLFVRKRGARESLIRVREHWIRELYQSVEEL
jgi:hypothetical protein